MISLHIDTSDLEKVITRMPPALKKRMVDGLDYAGNKFYKTFNPRLRGRPGIMSRRGGIAMRFKRTVASGPNGDGVGIRLYAKSSAAVRHEFGGEIEGFSGKRVAVPLSARGSYLMSSIYEGFGRVKSRFLPGKNKRIRPIQIKGQWYLAEIKRKKGQDETLPLFVLKDRVTYPARLGFYNTWNSVEPIIFKKLADKLRDGAKEAWDEA